MLNLRSALKFPSVDSADACPALNDTLELLSSNSVCDMIPTLAVLSVLSVPSLIPMRSCGVIDGMYTAIQKELCAF